MAAFGSWIVFGGGCFIVGSLFFSQIRYHRQHINHNSINKYVMIHINSNDTLNTR
jgi:hypothetical protein